VGRIGAYVHEGDRPKNGASGGADTSRHAPPSIGKSVLVTVYRFEPASKRGRDFTLLDFHPAMLAHEGAEIPEWLSEVSSRQRSLPAFLLLPRLATREEEGEPGGDAYRHKFGNEVSDTSSHGLIITVDTDSLKGGALSAAPTLRRRRAASNRRLWGSMSRQVPYASVGAPTRASPTPSHEGDVCKIDLRVTVNQSALALT
jgi:hypothetical protein